jgi:hypothetical protein
MKLFIILQSLRLCLTGYALLGYASLRCLSKWSIGGSATIFYQSSLERTELVVESPAQCQWEHSACCMPAIVRISPN